MGIDKKAIPGAVLRTVLQGMSTLRIMHWLKQRMGREMTVSLKYEGTLEGSQPVWRIHVTEQDGSTVFDQTADSFEQVNSMLVVALGRDF